MFKGAPSCGFVSDLRDQDTQTSLYMVHDDKAKGKQQQHSWLVTTFSRP